MHGCDMAVAARDYKQPSKESSKNLKFSAH